jgi:hypothetical protein
MTKLSNLEKRVEKLEEQIASLMKSSSDNPRHTAMDLARPAGRHHKTAKHKKDVHKHGKTKKKRKINKYFQMMLDAKRAGKPSFVYNGHTYKGTKHPRLGMVYKKG